MQDRPPSVASPAAPPSRAEVLRRIAAELERCSTSLRGVQDEISELLHHVPVSSPQSSTRLQSVDHVTQILGSLGTLVHAISLDLASGTDRLLDRKNDLPILREIRDRLLLAEGGMPDDNEDPDHVADWL